MLSGMFSAVVLMAAAGLVPFEPGSVKLGGEIGHHLDLTVDKILHHTDVDRDFVAPFRRRVAGDGKVSDLPKIGGTRGGFVGYGMLLDAVVKACARKIGGAELMAFKERRIAELISLQAADGAISMFTSVPKGKIGWPQAAVWDNHEAFYIIQAFVGDWTHFKNRAALDAAVKLADHLIEREGFVNVGGETAFIALWQATGEVRFRNWLDTRADLRRSLEHGYGELLAANSVYHVYTGLARACAQLEYAAAIGSDEACYFNTPRTLAGRLFGPYSSVTGSCAGGKPDGEGEFWRTTQRGTGRWGETCATAYMMRFATKMMATDPRSRYGDLIERGLYNAFFSAQSPDGVRYRYFNPFEENGEWWPRDTYCCPNNFRREMFEVVDAAILKAPKGAAVNLYSDATLHTQELTLEMKTRYPEDGEVAIAVDCAVPRELWLRIPAWCPRATVTVGSVRTAAAGGDWHRLNLPEGRTRIGLSLPIVDRYVAGFEEQSGKVALLRGPLVYGFDRDGRRVRFSDYARERVYFAPPPDVTPVSDELYAPPAKAAVSNAAVRAANPYGLCAHPMQDEFDTRGRMFEMMAKAGAGSLRGECLWGLCQPERDGPISFRRFDLVCESAAAKGIEIVPILHGAPRWARPVQKHLDAYRRFVRAFMAHYGSRFPVIEVWNEENGRHFWPPQPDAAEYAELLKVSHEEIKAAAPSVRICLGGLAGIPLDYVEALYARGAARHFDLMCVHPYVHPVGPEGWLVEQFGRLRDVMARHGDAKKPVWFSELGWPTHLPSVGGEGGLLFAGLKAAHPERTAWRVVFAENIPDGQRANQQVAEEFVRRLPGSSAEALGPAQTVEALTRGGVDAVVFPTVQLYPKATVAAVERFVSNGGTLVVLGGLPFWNAYLNLPDGRSERRSNEPDFSLMKRLHVGVDAWFLNDRTAPRELTVFATDEGKAAGVKLEPTGLKAKGFFTRANLSGTDEFVPLLEGTVTGRAHTAACVVKLDGGRKGSLVLGSVEVPNKTRGVTETEQAALLARSYGVAMALGVERYCWYEFRSPENDPYYSEDHFGLVRRDFSPKPAYEAYRAFVSARPVGSVQDDVSWREGRSGLQYPQWRRPDGAPAGMVWAAESGRSVCQIEFDGAGATFSDLFGKPVEPLSREGNVCRVSVGDAPVYFKGARLVRVTRMERQRHDGGGAVATWAGHDGEASSPHGRGREKVDEKG